MTTAEATRIMARLKNAFPHVQMTPGTVTEYGKQIIEFEAQDADVGVDELLRTTDRWPAIAVLRRYIIEARAARYERIALPPAEEPEPEMDEETRQRALQLLARYRGGLHDDHR